MNLKADELYLIRTGLKHAQRKTRDQIDPDFVPEPGRFDSNISKYHRITRLINKITDELEKTRELEKTNTKNDNDDEWIELALEKYRDDSVFDYVYTELKTFKERSKT